MVSKLELIEIDSICEQYFHSHHHNYTKILSYSLALLTHDDS